MWKEIVFFTYMAAILLSAVTAIVFRKWLKGRMLALFVPFLLYVFIQESALYLGKIYHWYTRNNFAYNVFRLGTVLVFAWLYYHPPFMKPVRKYIASLAILYIIAFIINFGFVQSIHENSSYLGLARGLIITVYGILFLFCYFHFDDMSAVQFWTPWVWITTGIVIFYPVVSISLTFQPYLANAKIYGSKLYQLIPQLMSIFMYGCFSYAFYLCKKKPI